MRDTLAHLVGETIHRPDATKFIFVLNQMDTTARDDNPEEVVGAWQRAVAQEGLTAGRFYCIYNPDAAVPIEDEALRNRYEHKRDHDLAEIHLRIQTVGVERGYRITGTLEKLAHHIQEEVIPRLREYKRHWRKLVLWGDAFLAAGFLLAAIALSGMLGFRDGLTWTSPGWWQGSASDIAWTAIALAFAVGLFGYLHFRLRRVAAVRVVKRIAGNYAPGLVRDRMQQAFLHNTRPWHSTFRKTPVGWHNRTRRRLQDVIAQANRYVQTLNDKFTDPSGELAPREQPASAPVAAPPVLQPASADTSNEEPQEPVRS
jgi:hypothetical protein